MKKASEMIQTYLRIYRVISEEFRGRFGDITLTFPQTMVLSLLGFQGSMPISELAASIGSANSTISGVLDRLERMDLVQRIRSEEDRRVVYVSTTDHFAEVQQELVASLESGVPGALNRLGSEELSQVLSGLAVLEQALTRKD